MRSSVLDASPASSESGSQYFWFVRSPGAPYRFKYWEVCEELNRMANERNYEGLIGLLREVTFNDLFAFGYFILGLTYLNCPWGVARCYDVQEDHHYTLDLWPRGHFKSTIISFMLPLWLAARNPDERQAWFSHTRAQAMVFLKRVKTECERNTVLKHVYADSFFMNPQTESERWTETKCIIRRSRNYPDDSFEAWGFIERLPTGKHFTRTFYDDIVTEEAISTPHRMKKVSHAFKLSRNLVDDTESPCMTGTYYSYNDEYVKQKKTGMWKVREYAGTVDGTPTGKGVLWSDEKLAEKRLIMGEYVFSSQILMNPVPESMQVFKIDWLKGRFFTTIPTTPLRKYLLVDPSGGGEFSSGKYDDWCVMMVIGVDQFNQRYLLDMVRDKFSLTMRWETLKRLSMMWNPVCIGYEKYGMQADLAYIDERRMTEGVYLPTVHPLKGNLPKMLRIRTLVPLFESGRMFLPKALRYRDVNGVERDLIREFIDEEYLMFPKPIHYDMLDVMARQMEDDPIKFSPPTVSKPKVDYREVRFDPFKEKKVEDWRTW